MIYLSYKPNKSFLSRKCVITAFFLRKIYDYVLTDSFWGSSGFLDSAATLRSQFCRAIFFFLAGIMHRGMIWTFLGYLVTPFTPPFKCVSLSPILNGSVHWGIVFTLSKGNEMNWMNVCVMFFSIYIFPRPFNIVYGPCLFYTRWYHDHYVFTKSYSWNFITTSFGSI